MNYQNNWRIEAFLKGLALGIAVMTIAWVLVVERTKKIHKQDLDYIIQTNNEVLTDSVKTK